MQVKDLAEERRKHTLKLCTKKVLTVNTGKGKEGAENARNY